MSASNKKLVLLIEPSHAVRAGIARVLDAYYEIVEAEDNAPEVINEALGGKKPDLILTTNTGLASMKGFDWLQQLRTDHLEHIAADTPAILMSVEDIESQANAVSVPFINKHDAQDQLLAKVKEALK